MSLCMRVHSQHDAQQQARTNVFGSTRFSGQQHGRGTHWMLVCGAWKTHPARATHPGESPMHTHLPAILAFCILVAATPPARATAIGNSSDCRIRGAHVIKHNFTRTDLDFTVNFTDFNNGGQIVTSVHVGTWARGHHRSRWTERQDRHPGHWTKHGRLRCRQSHPCGERPRRRRRRPSSPWRCG